MGMYTELIFKASIRVKINSIEQAVIQCLFNGHDVPVTLPDHPFFKSPRWDMVTTCSSFYHHPTAYNNLVDTQWNLNGYTEYYVFSRADLKNYDDEIELFRNWIDPYVGEEKGKCIGWMWYEEWNEPMLIYKMTDYVESPEGFSND